MHSRRQHLCSKHHPNFCSYLTCSSCWDQDAEELQSVWPVQQYSHWHKIFTSPYPPQQGRVKGETQRRATSHRNQRSDDGEGRSRDRDEEETIQSMTQQSLEGSREKQQQGITCKRVWKGLKEMERLKRRGHHTQISRPIQSMGWEDSQPVLHFFLSMTNLHFYFILSVSCSDTWHKKES